MPMLSWNDLTTLEQIAILAQCPDDFEFWELKYGEYKRDEGGAVHLNEPMETH